MPNGRRRQIPTDSLLHLRQRLERLPRKSSERARQVASFAELYGVSTTTVYRAINTLHKPRLAHRSDHGQPRVMPKAELERYCELIAALKLRTSKDGMSRRAAPSSCWKTTGSRRRRAW
jgi:hypothetical protein